MWTKREGTPMERKLGLYVTLGNDGSLKRTLVSVSGETELEATTLNDEVILFSELIFDFYAFIVDRIRLSAAYLVTQDGDGKDTVDMRVFEFIQDTVQDLIEEFEEDDPLYGTLTRTIMEDRIPAADGSDTYPVTAVEKIISELSAVMLPAGYALPCPRRSGQEIPELAGGRIHTDFQLFKSAYPRVSVPFCG